MNRRSPSLGASQQSASSNFSIDPCSLVVQGCLLVRGIAKLHVALKLVQQTMTFFGPLLSIVTSQEMTIKHLMYTWKVPFLYTERACVLFFQFLNLPRKIFYVNQSVLPLDDTNFVHDLHENTQDNSPSSSEDDEFQECQEYHPDQDLEPPTDDWLDFRSTQEHSDNQLDQVLQTYQAYQESQSESQTPTRQLNVHITYHVAQAN